MILSPASVGKLCLSGNDTVMVYEMSGKTTVKRADFHSYERIFQVMTTSVRHMEILPHIISLYVVPCSKIRKLLGGLCRSVH